MAERQHVLHTVDEGGGGDARGGVLRRNRKQTGIEGVFGSVEEAQSFGQHACTNPMGPLLESVILIFTLRVFTKEEECAVAGKKAWIKIVERALKMRPSGNCLRKGSLEKLFTWMEGARMGGLDLVTEGKAEMMDYLRETVGLTADEVAYLWKMVFNTIFMCAASSARTSFAQVHTPSARDMLNYSLVKGAGELVAATNGTVTQDLTFDQLIARALKLKQMGKIKDFGL